MQGSIVGVIKGDTRSLDYGSYSTIILATGKTPQRGFYRRSFRGV